MNDMTDRSCPGSVDTQTLGRPQCMHKHATHKQMGARVVFVCELCVLGGSVRKASKMGNEGKMC